MCAIVEKDLRNKLEQLRKSLGYPENQGNTPGALVLNSYMYGRRRFYGVGRIMNSEGGEMVFCDVRGTSREVYRQLTVMLDLLVHLELREKETQKRENQQ